MHYRLNRKEALNAVQSRCNASMSRAAGDKARRVMFVESRREYERLLGQDKYHVAQQRLLGGHLSLQPDKLPGEQMSAARGVWASISRTLRWTGDLIKYLFGRNEYPARMTAAYLPGTDTILAYTDAPARISHRQLMEGLRGPAASGRIRDHRSEFVDDLLSQVTQVATGLTGMDPSAVNRARARMTWYEAHARAESVERVSDAGNGTLSAHRLLHQIHRDGFCMDLAYDNPEVIDSLMHELTGSVPRVPFGKSRKVQHIEKTLRVAAGLGTDASGAVAYDEPTVTERAQIQVPSPQSLIDVLVARNEPLEAHAVAVSWLKQQPESRAALIACARSLYRLGSASDISDCLHYAGKLEGANVAALQREDARIRGLRHAGNIPADSNTKLVRQFIDDSLDGAAFSDGGRSLLGSGLLDPIEFPSFSWWSDDRNRVMQGQG